MKVSLLINDQDVAAANGATFERLNPISGAIASTAAAAGAHDATAAADAAAAAFPAWSALGPNERRARLNRAADLLQSRAKEFVTIMTAEIGAASAWAQFNVRLATQMLREAAAMTTQICGEVMPSERTQRLAMSIRQPAGVAVGIAPWNAPIILAVRAIAMPLACGNTVILKASELCPGTHRMIGDVMRDAGLGAGVVNVVTNAPDDAPIVVQTLIEHPAVRRINFTGSTRVGKIVAEIAARQLKPVLLELGGKAPMIVLEDADLDEAVAAAAFSAFMNQGQICMSTERLVVQDTVADAFVAKLATKAASLKVGDPTIEPDVAIGSMIGIAPITRAQQLLEDATKKGARIVTGNEVNGTIMRPTVIDFVTPEMKIYHEETFAPVVCIVRVKDVEEAIQVGNDTEYGLAGAVFTRDMAVAMDVARRLQSGSCHINGPTVQDEAHMPFGGMKASGYGRFGGHAAIHEFTDLRWITMETGPVHYPI
jgi:vanillin dehydrogenase